MTWSFDRQLELVAASHDVERARGVAEAFEGRLLVDARDDRSLPFRALVSAVTDDLDALLGVADVGCYVACRRVIKPRRSDGPPAPALPLPGAIALFTMIRHPKLSHGAADRHWRDRHAPLALQHHVAMTHYTQLSIVHRIHGPEWDGFALCGFDSVADLRERFFETAEGRQAIREDVSRFADPERSPRRLIVTETSYHAEDDR